MLCVLVLVSVFVYTDEQIYYFFGIYLGDNGVVFFYQSPSMHLFFDICDRFIICLVAKNDYIAMFVFYN